MQTGGQLVEVSGGRVWIERHGRAGPRIVLVGEVGYDARLWRPQVERLVDTHRIVTIDLRGHGGSPGAPDDGEIPAAADVLDVLDALGLDGAVLGALGETGGAMLDLATRASDRLVGLLLCQPHLPGMSIPMDFDPSSVAADAEQRFTELLTAIERNDVDALVDAMLRDPVNQLPRRPDLQQLVDAMIRDNAHVLLGTAGAPRLKPLEAKPVAERLDRIDCSVTVALRAPATTLEQALVGCLRDGLPHPTIIELETGPDAFLLPLVEPETVAALLAELAVEP